MAAQQRARTVWDGVYTLAQAERGHDLYDERCSGCHGDDLGGDVVEHPSLAGGRFQDTWNGQTLGDLFDRIHRDMPMDEPGSLSRAETAQLVAFILSANRFPEGKQALPTDMPALNEIRIESKKPTADKSRN